MKIQPARIDQVDGAITVQYAFETRKEGASPEPLWFRVAAQWRDWIHSGPEPAIAALTFLAMALGEDVEVEEPVSPRFHYGLERSTEHFHLWWPSLRPVTLTAPGFAPLHPDGRAVVSCFSGGVDSFHTLYGHLDGAPANRHFALTHLLFIHGFDIPLENVVYDELADEFSALAESLHLGFIRVATNVRHLLDPCVTWDRAHGSCLAASMLLLSGGASRFITPSTNRQSQLFIPCGSNPITDPLLVTEAADVLHFGTHRSRIEKILAIADRREVQEHLRVCWQNVPGRRNCGRCVKCLKTMMPLAIIGALDRFTVFPSLPPWSSIDRECFAMVDLSGLPAELSYAHELRALAAEHGVGEFPHRQLIEQRLRQRAKMVVRGAQRLVARRRGS